MKRIKRFGVYQTSKVVAIIYFCVSIVFVLPIGLISSIAGGFGGSGFPFGGVFILLAPFIYGIMGFVMTAIACGVYNLIASHTGGIEFEVEVSENI